MFAAACVNPIKNASKGFVNVPKARGFVAGLVPIFVQMQRIAEPVERPVSTAKAASTESANVQNHRAFALQAELICAWISTKTPRIAGLAMWCVCRGQNVRTVCVRVQVEKCCVQGHVWMRCVILHIVGDVERRVQHAVRSAWMGCVLVLLIKASVSWMERMLVWICIKIPVDAVDAHPQRRFVLRNKPVSKGLVLPRRSLLKCGEAGDRMARLDNGLFPKGRGCASVCCPRIRRIRGG